MMTQKIKLLQTTGPENFAKMTFRDAWSIIQKRGTRLPTSLELDEFSLQNLPKENRKTLLVWTSDVGIYLDKDDFQSMKESHLSDATNKLKISRLEIEPVEYSKLVILSNVTLSDDGLIISSDKKQEFRVLSALNLSTILCLGREVLSKSALTYVNFIGSSTTTPLIMPLLREISYSGEGKATNRVFVARDSSALASVLEIELEQSVHIGGLQIDRQILTGARREMAQLKAEGKEVPNIKGILDLLV